MGSIGLYVRFFRIFGINTQELAACTFVGQLVKLTLISLLSIIISGKTIKKNLHK